MPPGPNGHACQHPTLRSFDPGKDRAFLECRSGEFICLVKARGEEKKHPHILGVQHDILWPWKERIQWINSSTWCLSFNVLVSMDGFFGHKPWILTSTHSYLRVDADFWLGNVVITTLSPGCEKITSIPSLFILPFCILLKMLFGALGAVDIRKKHAN